MRTLLALSAVLLTSATRLWPPSVKADHGNIVLTEKGKARVLTKTGHDSDPVRQPGRHHHVVFVRALTASALKDCANIAWRS